jgi:hypothetical protein
MVYPIIDMFYLTSVLIGRILLRQPAWRWPPIFERPWTSTSLADLWSFRWHQTFRYMFFELGPRPLERNLGGPERSWVRSRCREHCTISGCGTRKGNGAPHCYRILSPHELLMSVGTALEYGFKQATGHRVGGLWGWVWSVVWSVGWGTLDY